MKPLLSKTTKPFLVYVLSILLLSVPAYYWVIEKIWVTELDEYNQLLAKRTEKAFNTLPLSNDDTKDKIKFWNDIQPGIFIKEYPYNHPFNDSIFTADAQSLYVPKGADDNYRVLITTIKINDKPYYFRAVTSFEDTRETITAILLVTVFFFACILVGLLVLNRKLSKTAWLPFRNTLQRLKAFNLNRESRIEFDKTDVLEFAELNQSLGRLIEQNVSVYKTQKEFTENASHELQTPLAVIKNKIDILLQSEDLTEHQYIIAEEINRALSRSARINKNLLLLAKIDNSQFDVSEIINMQQLLQQSLEMLHEHFEQKNLNIKTDLISDFRTKGNSSLAEILVNNLLLNAIRYTLPRGSISVSLTESCLTVANSSEQPLDETLLFKRFSKLSGDNNSSGLGLSIAGQICKFHNWQVQYSFKNGFHIFSVGF